MSGGELGLLIGLVIGTPFGFLLCGALSGRAPAEEIRRAYLCGRMHEARLRDEFDQLMSDAPTPLWMTDRSRLLSGDEGTELGRWD